MLHNFTNNCTQQYNTIQKLYTSEHIWQTIQSLAKLYKFTKLAKLTTLHNSTQRNKTVYNFTHFDRIFSKLYTSLQLSERTVKTFSKLHIHLSTTIHNFFQHKTLKHLYTTCTQLHTNVHNFHTILHNFTHNFTTFFTNLCRTLQNFIVSTNSVTTYTEKLHMFALSELDYTILYTTLHIFANLYNTLQQFFQLCTQRYTTLQNFFFLRNLTQLCTTLQNLTSVEHSTQLYNTFTNLSRNIQNGDASHKTLRYSTQFYTN